MMLSVEFACIFRGNVAIGISSVKPPLRSDLNQLASLIPGVIHYDYAAYYEWLNVRTDSGYVWH